MTDNMFRSTELLLNWSPCQCLCVNFWVFFLLGNLLVTNSPVISDPQVVVHAPLMNTYLLFSHQSLWCQLDWVSLPIYFYVFALYRLQSDLQLLDYICLLIDILVSYLHSEVIHMLFNCSEWRTVSEVNGSKLIIRASFYNSRLHPDSATSCPLLLFAITCM